MILFPAIDIKAGRCVRLRRGDFSTAEQVAEDALDTARAFAAAGSGWVHMVDLDGAAGGSPENRALFLQVAAQSGLKVQLGGGIRTMEQIEDYLQNGIERVILGSVAVRDPQLVRRAVEAFGARVAVGIDAVGGRVATQGWLETSDVGYLDLARAMCDAGVQTLIFTDIDTDGMLCGPNLRALERLQGAVDCQIIASGGIATLADIAACRDLGLYGAICGKALYAGRFGLDEALATAKGGA